MKTLEEVRNLVEKEAKTVCYLSKFEKEQYPDLNKYRGLGTDGEDTLEKIMTVGDEIIEKLKAQELTYADAYITLEYVYRKLKFNNQYTHL